MSARRRPTYLRTGGCVSGLRTPAVYPARVLLDDVLTALLVSGVASGDPAIAACAELLRTLGVQPLDDDGSPPESRSTP